MGGMIAKEFLRLLRQVASVAFPCVGVIFLALSGVFALFTRSFIQRAVSTDGTVVKLVEFVDRQHGDVDYAPVFTFAAMDGQKYTIASSVRSSPPAYSLGEHVRVLYDKNNPANAKLSSFTQLWFLPTTFAILGGIFTLVGVVLLVILSRRSQVIKVQSSL
ncbi:MAG TPA: DUF3592 domain-containing protein [Terracidiphilus sp.]|jgi:membrane protein implicated in regulation of membrane protease activity|nr:DUF3592 domain-containing protein [Terracidiphilus sp.]